MTSRLQRTLALAFFASLAVGAGRAEATNYVVNNSASATAFLSAIGATGSVSLGTTMNITGGTLPVGDALTIGADMTLRTQTGTFTNYGSITINSTETGFYGAGTLDNRGSFVIQAADAPLNFATILNDGSFVTNVPFTNQGTFKNFCNGTVTGTILELPVTIDCAVPVQPTTWGHLKARFTH